MGMLEGAKGKGAIKTKGVQEDEKEIGTPKVGPGEDGTATRETGEEEVLPKYKEDTVTRETRKEDEPTRYKESREPVTMPGEKGAGGAPCQEEREREGKRIC